jgi:hypothetical protein
MGDTGALHYRDLRPSGGALPSPYEQAILATAAIVHQYDNDLSVPCFGFGASKGDEVG